MYCCEQNSLVYWLRRAVGTASRLPRYHGLRGSGDRAADANSHRGEVPNGPTLPPLTPHGHMGTTERPAMWMPPTQHLETGEPSNAVRNSARAVKAPFRATSSVLRRGAGADLLVAYKSAQAHGLKDPDHPRHSGSAPNSGSTRAQPAPPPSAKSGNSCAPLWLGRLSAPALAKRRGNPFG